MAGGLSGFQGKRIVIGGAGGMGSILAMRLADAGARVLVGDISRAGLEALSSRSNGVVQTEPCDFAEMESIDRLAQRAARDFGGLDGVAITVADLSQATHGQDHDLLNFSADIWERALRVNLIGHAQLMKAAAPHLKAAGGGSIVTISSGSAYAGDLAQPAYAASKAGLHALVRHAARLLGRDLIRCNGVAPGLIMTETAKAHMDDDMRDAVVSRQSLPRAGVPEDVCAAIEFLLSEQCIVDNRASDLG